MRLARLLHVTRDIPAEDDDGDDGDNDGREIGMWNSALGRRCPHPRSTFCALYAFYRPECSYSC